jgi:hypothetical protein
LGSSPFSECVVHRGERSSHSNEIFPVATNFWNFGNWLLACFFSESMMREYGEKCITQNCSTLNWVFLMFFNRAYFEIPGRVILIAANCSTV